MPYKHREDRIAWHARNRERQLEQTREWKRQRAYGKKIDDGYLSTVLTFTAWCTARRLSFKEQMRLAMRKHMAFRSNLPMRSGPVRRSMMRGRTFCNRSLPGLAR